MSIYSGYDMRATVLFHGIVPGAVICIVAVLSLAFGLLVCPAPALASDTVRKLEVIENLRFNSFSSDGKHFVFTRFDATGNKYELVFYDLKERKPVFVIPDLPTTTRFLSSDDRHVFVNEGGIRDRASIIAIEKDPPYRRTTLKLESTDIRADAQRRITQKPNRKGIKGLFSVGNRLCIIRSLQFNDTDLCLMYDAKTLEPLAQREIERSQTYLSCADRIVGIGKRIIVYDRELTPIHQQQNELKCQLGLTGTLKGRLFFSDICGKIYEYTPEDNVRRVLVDLGALDLPSGLHRFDSLNFDINDDGLLVAMHSNKESYPKLIDTKSGRVLATLELSEIPNYIVLDETTLYFIFSDWLGKKSRIEIYAIDKPMLYSDSFYTEHLAMEHAKALQVYHDTKDFYKAIEALENADVASIVNGSRQVRDSLKINVLNDYAYFLSLAYDRHKDAIPLLEHVINLSPERASAYLNLADAYYKIYRYDGHDSQVLQRATVYYEQYVQLMDKDGEAKNALNRTFPVEADEPVIKRLPADFMEFNLRQVGPLFWKNRIFLDDSWYGSTDFLGPTVGVYNRDDYTLLRKLETIGNDKDQQDRIASIQIQKGKLFVRTACSEEDCKRTDLFVFDLNNFAKLSERHEESHEQEASLEQQFFGLDTSFAKTDNARQLDEFVRSGKKLEHVRGSYKTNNARYLITSDPEKEKKFHIYDLVKLERHENLDLTRRKAGYHLFDDLDKVAITYFTSAKTYIEIHDIASSQRRTILSLGNDGGSLGMHTPVIKTYRNYLIIVHRRDLILYDAKKMQIAKVIRDVIPKTGVGKSSSRITTLVVDNEKKRLLVISKPREFNSFLDIDFLK